MKIESNIESNTSDIKNINESKDKLFKIIFVNLHTLTQNLNPMKPDNSFNKAFYDFADKIFNMDILLSEFIIINDRYLSLFKKTKIYNKKLQFFRDNCDIDSPNRKVDKIFTSNYNINTWMF